MISAAGGNKFVLTANAVAINEKWLDELGLAQKDFDDPDTPYKESEEYAYDNGSISIEQGISEAMGETFPGVNEDDDE